MAIDHKFTNTNAPSILDLLQSSYQFKVPRFQRNYSWKIEKAEAMWNDMLDNFKIIQKDHDAVEESQYLLGPIVLLRDHKNNRTFYVIDGQQRLSTITMILCVARDIILEDIDKEGIQKPDGFDKITELIENTRLGEHQSWKLELNDTDKIFFREIQEYEINPESQLTRIKKLNPTVKSLKYLRNNYIFFHEQIYEMLYANFDQETNPNISDMSEDEKRKERIKHHPMLLHFLTFMRENNFLISLTVSDDGTAFQIFETLNERGETLSKSNLIKNHILNKIGNEDMQVELSNQWNKIFDEIVGDGQSDDDFIMESYHSRYDDETSLRNSIIDNTKMSKKNLYKIIKCMVHDEKTCRNFISELEKDAEFLSMLNDPSRYFDEDSKDDIQAIKSLNAKFIRIPLLAAYRKLYDSEKPSDYVDLAKFLVKFFFKIRVVRAIHPGKIENIIMDVTKMINNGKSINDIMIKLKSEDDHDDFIYHFKNKLIINIKSDVAKYVLQKITIHLGTEHDDVKPIDHLTLEHILPLKHDKWNEKNFFGTYDGDNSIHEFKKRLGNMTLLKNTINSKIRNDKFELKKNAKNSIGKNIGYMGSKLAINEQTVCNYNEWTANIIIERETKFVNYAKKIWVL